MVIALVYLFPHIGRNLQEALRAIVFRRTADIEYMLGALNQRIGADPMVEPDRLLEDVCRGVKEACGARDVAILLEEEPGMTAYGDRPPAAFSEADFRAVVSLCSRQRSAWLERGDIADVACLEAMRKMGAYSIYPIVHEDACRGFIAVGPHAARAAAAGGGLRPARGDGRPAGGGAGPGADGAGAAAAAAAAVRAGEVRHARPPGGQRRPRGAQPPQLHQGPGAGAAGGAGGRGAQRRGGRPDRRGDQPPEPHRHAPAALRPPGAGGEAGDRPGGRARHRAAAPPPRVRAARRRAWRWTCPRACPPCAPARTR